MVILRRRAESDVGGARDGRAWFVAVIAVVVGLGGATSAHAGVCTGPEAQQALVAAVAPEGAPHDARFRGRFGIYQTFTSAWIDHTKGTDAWALVHAGAPLFVRAEADAPVTLVACSYAVDGRVDRQSPAQLVRGFRFERRGDAGGVVVDGLDGFSAAREWRGPRLVTLLFVTGVTGVVRYRLMASTSPPSPPSTTTTTTTN